MSTAKPKGRRLGGPPTLSTTEDTTPPEAPTAPPLAEAAPRQDLVPAAPPLPAQAPPGPPPVPPRDVTIPPQAPTAPPARPRAEDLVKRAEDVGREQVNAMVPKVLDLRRRMKIYGALYDVELRDIVSMALDEWLTRRNY